MFCCNKVMFHHVAINIELQKIIAAKSKRYISTENANFTTIPTITIPEILADKNDRCRKNRSDSPS